MSFRRDTVTSTTTRTPEGGPVRWWLLIVGALAVLTLLTWGFASSVHRATVSEAQDALAAAGLTAVAVDGGAYRDLTLTGPAADESAARAALDALALPYAVTYSASGQTPQPSPSPGPSAAAARASPAPTPSAEPSMSPEPSEEPVVIADLPSLAGIQFETGSATLTGPSAGVLDQAASAIVAALDSHPTLHIAINGYTDNQGDPAANLLLSQQRADAVSQYLAGHGVPADALTATGFGDASPIASNDSADGRAANRRVDFVSTER